jgi:hypothetical protein
MKYNTTYGIDTAKNVFHLVHMNHMGRVLGRRKLNRSRVLSFLAKQEKACVVIKSCSGSQTGQERSFSWGINVN